MMIYLYTDNLEGISDPSKCTELIRGNRVPSLSWSSLSDLSYFQLLTNLRWMACVAWPSITFPHLSMMIMSSLSSEMLRSNFRSWVGLILRADCHTIYPQYMGFWDLCGLTSLFVSHLKKKKKNIFWGESCV